MSDSPDELEALLERDYRRLLRWYPRSWREAHGDALVGTLLDEADADDRFLVEPGEWRLFASAGIEARLSRVASPRIRDAASTVVLAIGAGGSLVLLAASSGAPWGSAPVLTTPSFGPFLDAGPLLTGLWLIALLTACIGRWWLGRLALLASVAAALLMHPLQTLVAPMHRFALDATTLTFFSACAIVVVLGTPRRRVLLLASTVGTTAVAWACLVYAGLAGRLPGEPAIPFLLSASDLPTWIVLLALSAAACFALVRRWTPACTILLAVVPAVASLDAAAITMASVGVPPSAPATLVLINAVTAGGLVVLVRVARGTRAAERASDRLPGVSRRRRRAAVIGAALAPLLVLTGAGTAFAATGADWTRPAAVDWSRMWRGSTDARWIGWALHPDASLRYRLPGGGSCTIRFGDLPIPPHTSTPTPDQIALDYLRTSTEDGTLLRDARLDAVIQDIRTWGDSAQNFWGVRVPYGYGTENYNADYEYVIAVQIGVQAAVNHHLEESGATGRWMGVATQQRCTGAQR